jgi:GMP synthase (glutamine-hydrolysing)
MKILLVNNHTVHLDALKETLSGHQLEIVTYRPGVNFNETGKDLVVLSGGGGEGFEIDDEARPGQLWYNDEMEFVLRCDKPILGICMGFEIITRAYGGQVRQLKSLVQGHKNLKTTKLGHFELNKKTIRQFESHEWHVPYISTRKFDVLADSATGIELVRHKKRPILASQFHPEKGGTLKVNELLANLA